MNATSNRLLEKTSSLLFSSLLLILLTATSCQKDDLPGKPAFETPPAKEGMIKLGRKLENPYTVENMRKAYANLVSQGVLKSGLVIDATHIYIRVIPATEEKMDAFESHLLQYLNAEDLELLEESISGHFFSYPLDYEILEGGYYFYDPQLPPGGITWQYTVIPVSYANSMPPIQHEVLADLFLKCDFGIAEKSSKGFDQASWQLLETEALRLAGDPDAELLSSQVLKSSGGRWTPGGRITLKDDSLGVIPLQGARVLARRWFHVHEGITNTTGEFRVNGTFRRPVRYKLKWERRYWDIRIGNIGQAYFKIAGEKTTNPLTLHIEGGRSLGLATVHQAAYLYYFGQNTIKRPPTRRGVNKLNVSYFHDNANDPNIGGSAHPLHRLILPEIKVYGKTRNRLGLVTARCTQGIYATMIHELAHASHWDLVGRPAILDKELNVVESWARGVQWWLTRMVHAYYPGGSTIRPIYTQVVVDMIDSSLDDETNNGANFPFDKVEGYTMQQIENALVGAFTWDQWKNNILNMYENDTEIYLEALFNHWN